MSRFELRFGFNTRRLVVWTLSGGELGIMLGGSSFCLDSWYWRMSFLGSTVRVCGVLIQGLAKEEVYRGGYSRSSLQLLVPFGGANE